MQETLFAGALMLPPNSTFMPRVHCEQISLNGDPALKYNPQPKPDYVIEDPLVNVSPSFISVAESSFKVNAQMLNIGKAVDITYCNRSKTHISQQFNTEII